MATTGWGLIYFNLLNIFKIHNLHTSLPLSACSAWHPHSSRPFVICCTAQSTFLHISCFPALFLVAAHFPAFPTSLCQSRQDRAEKTICVNFLGTGQQNFRQSSAGRSRMEKEGAGKRKPLTLPTIRVQLSLSDALTHRCHWQASQTHQEKSNV